jgi:hypothetical protein
VVLPSEAEEAVDASASDSIGPDGVYIPPPPSQEAEEEESPEPSAFGDGSSGGGSNLL